MTRSREFFGVVSYDDRHDFNLQSPGISLQEWTGRMTTRIRSLPSQVQEPFGPEPGRPRVTVVLLTPLFGGDLCDLT